MSIQARSGVRPALGRRDGQRSSRTVAIAEWKCIAAVPGLHRHHEHGRVLQDVWELNEWAWLDYRDLGTQAVDVGWMSEAWREASRLQTGASVCRQESCARLCMLHPSKTACLGAQGTEGRARRVRRWRL